MSRDPNTAFGAPAIEHAEDLLVCPPPTERAIVAAPTPSCRDSMLGRIRMAKQKIASRKVGCDNESAELAEILRDLDAVEQGLLRNPSLGWILGGGV